MGLIVPLYLFQQPGANLLPVKRRQSINSRINTQDVAAYTRERCHTACPLRLFNKGTTIANDGFRDQLSGGSGRDWFLDFLLVDSALDFSANRNKGDKKN